MPAAAAIETSRLSKTYGKEVRALADLDLRVERGEVFGFLGPNGAGKSTTIRLLLGLLRPTAGRAEVFGIDTWRSGVAARRHVGYLPGDLRLSDRLTGREQLDSLARLRGEVDEDLREQLCDRFGVVLDRPIRRLSKGNRQKLGLVQAFMSRPELVVLDEPTSGLDPLLQSEVRALLHETAGEGRTVFLSSHSLDEVQHVAHRVGIIRSGTLTDVDTVEGLRERSLRHVTITFMEPVDEARFAAIDGVRVVGVEGNVLHVSAPEPAMDALVKAAAAHAIVDLVSQPADLEEIFLELYREPADGRSEFLRRGLLDHRRALAAWCVGIFGYIALVSAIFPSIHGSPAFDKLVQNYPDVLKQFFGLGEGGGIDTGAGYVDLELFSLMLPLLVLVLAIGAGARTFAGEEDAGRLELVLAYPVRRRSAVLSKAIAVAAEVVAACIAAGVALLVLDPLVGLDLAFGKLVGALVMLAALGLLHGWLALSVGAAVPSRTLAVGVPAALAATGYLVNGLHGLAGWLDPFRVVSPFWLVGTSPLRSGVQGWGLAAVLIAAVAVLAAGTILVERRDLQTP